ncbi:MAG: acyltransferase [Tannerellaceae bacterium]|jgi:peptidoglycan/LPS O-acetylase OafA/YrhL|nr:acyltransferase [Tannerellaceae bacterium]
MKIEVLGGLRGFAAFAVLLGHLPQITDSIIAFYFKYFTWTSYLASSAVDVFFVLSGFLITRNLIRDKEKGRFSFKNFYLKRFLRIFPIYYLTIVLVGIFISWDGLQYIALYVSNYYFAFNLGVLPMRHTWSLAVEEHFYLLWPAIVYYCSLQSINKHWYKYCLGISIVSIVLFYVLFPLYPANTLVRISTNTRLISLIAGAIIAIHETRMRSLDNKSMNKIIALSFLSYATFFVLNAIYITRFIPYEPVFYVCSFVGSVSLFLWVLNLENRPANIMHKFFSSRIMTSMGLISYGLYLYHYPIYHCFGINTVVEPYVPVGLFRSFMPVLLSFAAAVLSYHFIEKPLLKIKDRIR